MRKYVLLLISALCTATGSFAQHGEPSEKAILEKLTLYTKANPDNLLFVHTDKTIYTNNETIWFSGYLVRAEGAQLNDHTILSVALMREDNRKIPIHSKYVMQDGLSFGSLTLPDSIPPGNYQIIAYTNVLDKEDQPLAIFIQPVTIKSLTHQAFNATLQLLDPMVTNGVVRAKVNLTIKDPDPLERVSISYSVTKENPKTITLKKTAVLQEVEPAHPERLS